MAFENCSQYDNILLLITFKLSYNTSIISTELNSANIVPIYKKGDKAVVSNYRPISLICVTEKLWREFQLFKMNYLLRLGCGGSY